jgi:phosphoglycerate dehydrogenase-like enzyme
MTIDVLCLRPRADFQRIGVEAPTHLRVEYRESSDSTLHERILATAALLIPAVGPKLSPALFEGSRLKLIQVTGSGLDRVDQGMAVKLGIPVCNVPGGSNSAVAEYAVTAAGTLLRRLGWSDHEIRSGNYAVFRARMIAENVEGLEGLTVGIVGFGTIGVAVAEAFARAGCGIVYHDPALERSAAAERLGATPMPLDTLLTTADIVSLHVPLLPTTRSLIGRRELSAMKQGAVLLQVSRGGVVDEAALAEALQSGHLCGAAVDVYSSEPMTNENPLLHIAGEAAHRLLLTPHIAGVTRQSWAFIFRSAWQNIERVLAGEPPTNRVY